MRNSDLLTLFFLVFLCSSIGFTADEVLVFEAEDWTTPKDAWLKDKSAPDKWNLWSTDKDAMRKWSGGVVLQSPPVKADRATPEDGAPPLHTHITGIKPGKYEVEIKLGRTLAVSLDGKKWEKKSGADNYLGVFDITDGTFNLWVDDRYADDNNPGSAYYDCLIFTPAHTRLVKPKVEGFATERVRERLDRGLVVLPLGNGRAYVGWRLLADDPADIAFNIYRSDNGAPPKKLNASPVCETTDFVDTTVPAAGHCEYSLRAVDKDGKEGPQLATYYLQSPASVLQDCIIFKLDENTTVQKVGIGDLDGDGRYDFVLKTPADNIDPAESYWKPSPDTYVLDARSHDGKRLWRKDLGWAIERGIWYSPMIVYDLDGDGKAEVALKTGEGDPRGPDGRVETGPEWLSILDGATGKELARADWPSRHIPGEKYNYNLSSRNQICVAYLDGKTPAVIVERGTYTTIRLEAYEFHNRTLKKLWAWDSREEGRRPRYSGQGAHIMHAADVDGDGRDEIIIGSAVVDDNGNGLWSTGFGHPDFCFVGDIDPLRPGLEIFYGIEVPHKENGLCLVDAKTGAVIWGLKEPTTHVGTDGMCADIIMEYPGSECHAANIDKDRKYDKSWLFTAQGKLISDKRQSGFARVAYWDSDLQRELVHGATIRDYNGAVHPPKLVGNYVMVADVLGDWREEIITSAPGELRIYTTTISAMDRRVCLMQDPIYRLDVAVAFMGYWAAPMLSYDIASRSHSLSISPSAGPLTPGTSTKGEILLQAAANEPLKGKLTLSVTQGGEVSPTSSEVNVPAGQISKAAFTITVPPVTGVVTERGSVSLNAQVILGARTLRAEAAFHIADQPVKGLPMVEAENIAAQDGGTVKVREDKIGASGKCISHWDAQGHWIEWKVSLPQAGRYHVALRYCNSVDSERDFKLDGNAPPGVERVVFHASGGMSEKNNDWQHAFIRDNAGNPVVFDLAAGEHIIRMTNLDAKPLNVDYLVFVPVK